MNVLREKYIKKCQEENVKNAIQLKSLKKDQKGTVRFQCKSCGLWFSKTKQIDYLKAYNDYTVHKFTYSEMEEKYRKSRKTLRRHFDNLDLAELKSDLGDKREINLVFDASHLKREFCLFLFRRVGKNIHYDFKDSEKIIHYEDCVKEISQKYRLSSFTIDGRKGVIQLLERMFPSVPI